MTTHLTPRPAITGAVSAPQLPAPRGPLSGYLFHQLVRPPRPLVLPPPVPVGTDVVTDEDLQLTLYCCYELHYRSFADVDERWEWEPSLLAFRRSLEQAFEAHLDDAIAAAGPVAGAGPAAGVERALAAVIAAGNGPSLSGWMLEQGTLDHMREFAVHRSAYQLKEADPHTWAIPRLHGGPKAALVEIQSDEYGGGVESEMHSSLFAVTMRSLGLDTAYAAYLDLIPAVTLATNNLVSLFGLHRRLRGALVGHLAIFESTSVGPMGRYGAALRRLGVGGGAERFYDVHVDADAHHQVVATRNLAADLAAQEPYLAEAIIFGAQALMLIEERFARHLLVAWEASNTSLLAPLTSPASETAQRLSR